METMNTTDLEIRIPATIADLPLTISEKIVLTHISSFPGCSNARLAELIGGSCRGVENLLHRLRQQNYIKQTGNGRARRHHLLFHVERHIKCGNNEITSAEAKSRRECGDQRCEPSVAPRGTVSILNKELPLVEDYEQTLNLIQEMMYQPGTFPETILFLYRKILKRVENEAPDMPAKEAAVRELTIRRDAFVAICYAMRMPRQHQRPALRMINTATPEKLAHFRQQIETGAAKSKTPLLLNDLATERETAPSK
jgi:DNA-binding MarR family transcriptional regulator